MTLLVRRALASLHGGSLEIMFKVPLIEKPSSLLILLITGHGIQSNSDKQRYAELQVLATHISFILNLFISSFIN